MRPMRAVRLPYITPRSRRDHAEITPRSRRDHAEAYLVGLGETQSRSRAYLAQLLLDALAKSNVKEFSGYNNCCVSKDLRSRMRGFKK